jgi:hypothetical protein
MRYQVSIALGDKIRLAESEGEVLPDHLLRAYKGKLSPNRTREAYFNAPSSKFMLCQTVIKDEDVEAWALTSPSDDDDSPDDDDID